MAIQEYELHKLGWHSFQQLCIALCKEIFGQTVERFLDSKDGGRDGAFTGVWQIQKNETITGRFIFQCKFTSKRDYLLSKADLADELKKVKRLVADGKCDNYIILTNAGVSGVASEEIENYFLSAGVKKVIVYGSTWINEQITENKRLRMLVPRVYGLGDLSEILDDRAFKQAKAVLNSMREDLSKVVLTDAYYQAANALDKHGFVLLVGEPAAGKTTIASMLALSGIDLWNIDVIKVDTPEKVKEHWNAENPPRLFWIDDAFGVMQYQETLVQGWNHILPDVKAMLGQGIKIIMTSRDYIYRRARHDLKEGSFPLFQESQVVINVHELSLEEKQQILYNHLKLGKQPIDFIKKIKPFLNQISEHERFIPEIARRLSEPAFTKNLSLYQQDIEGFVDCQKSFLIELIEGMDVDSKAALALIYMTNDALESPVVFGNLEISTIQRVGSTTAGCLKSLETMRDTFVQHAFLDDSSFWKYKHPTIGDAFAKFIVRSPEFLEIYIHGTSLIKLMSQITMGDVGLENAIIIPKSLYTKILDYLIEYIDDPSFHYIIDKHWQIKRLLYNFLSYRSSKEFLRQFIERKPEILGEISNPGLYLSAMPSVDLAIRLNELELFPEGYRQKFVNKVTGYAIGGEDLSILSETKYSKILNEEEILGAKTKIRNELIPRLGEIKSSLESSYDETGEELPGDYMDQFDTVLKTLKKEFVEYKDIIIMLDEHINDVSYWVDENTPEINYLSNNEYKQPEEIKSSNDTKIGRSIFDDIDS